MHIFTKFLAAFATMFLLTACETPPSDDSSTDGTGYGNTGDNAGNYGTSGGDIVPGTQSDLETNVGDRIFFALASSVVASDAQGTLERQAAWLQQYPTVHVSVEGHCDERGTREYNLALGERRATAAKNYLVSLGISADRISTISYGKERPAVLGAGESSWSQNRRAVTVIAH